MYRDLKDLTYNTIYYNHIWPNIALITDFLISDVITSSAGKISFPAQYAQGYAYLQSKVFGDQKGEFYGDKDVQLWMPADLLRSSTIQANYIAGYGNNKLYLAFTNQSKENLDLKVHINPDLVPYTSGVVYKVKVWINNKPVKETTMKNGVIDLSLSDRGITAVAIEGIKIKTRFQEDIFDAPKSLSEKSYQVSETAFGKVTGMIISMGKHYTNSYIWLEANDQNLSSAKITYKDNKGKMKTMEDLRFPFEFSIPLLGDEKAFEYTIEGVKPDGKKVVTERVILTL